MTSEAIKDVLVEYLEEYDIETSNGEWKRGRKKSERSGEVLRMFTNASNDLEICAITYRDDPDDTTFIPTGKLSYVILDDEEGGYFMFGLSCWNQVFGEALPDQQLDYILRFAFPEIPEWVLQNETCENTFRFTSGRTIADLEQVMSEIGAKKIID